MKRNRTTRRMAYDCFHPTEHNQDRWDAEDEKAKERKDDPYWAEEPEPRENDCDD